MVKSGEAFDVFTPLLDMVVEVSKRLTSLKLITEAKAVEIKEAFRIKREKGCAEDTRVYRLIDRIREDERIVIMRCSRTYLHVI